jgi:hypothetical protein
MNVLRVSEGLMALAAMYALFSLTHKADGHWRVSQVREEGMDAA